MQEHQLKQNKKTMNGAELCWTKGEKQRRSNQYSTRSSRKLTEEEAKNEEEDTSTGVENKQLASMGIDRKQADS